MMAGTKRCPKCGVEQDGLWKYCQKCGAEMPRPTEQQTITESRQRRWLRRFSFGFKFMITIGVGVYGFVLFNVELPTNTPESAALGRPIGVVLIGVAGIILFFLIRNPVKSWFAGWLHK